MLDYWFAVICHYLYLAILLSDATSLKTGCNPQSKTKKAHIFTYSVFLEIFAFLAKHFWSSEQEGSKIQTVKIDLDFNPKTINIP